MKEYTCCAEWIQIKINKSSFKKKKESGLNGITACIYTRKNSPPLWPGSDDLS